jgi:cytochrome P450
MSATATPTPLIPHAPGALPLVGHGLAILRQPLEFLNSLPAHGDIVQIQLGPTRVPLVCNPELVRTMLRNDRVFDKGGLLFDRGRELLGNGLVTCQHNEHRRQRRLLQPAFRQHCMPGYGQIIAEQMHAVLGTWQDDQVLDVVPVLKHLSTRVAAVALFSKVLPPDKLERIAEDVETFSAGVFRRILLPPIAASVPTPANVRYDRARQRLRRTIAEVIADYRANGIDSGGILPILMATRDDQSAQQQLSDEECSDQAITLFFAAIETLAIASAWALYLIAQNPDTRQRLEAEADQVLGGRFATYEDVPALAYTNRIVKETLRICSPAWLITRVVTEDTQLGGYQLPAGEVVGCSPLMMHLDPGIHPAAQAFDPDRWQEETAPHTDTVLPFSAGARKCIGDTFAMVEATLTLSSIASRWRIEAVPNGHPKPSFHAFYTPRNLKLKIAPRG